VSWRTAKLEDLSSFGWVGELQGSIPNFDQHLQSGSSSPATLSCWPNDR